MTWHALTGLIDSIVYTFSFTWPYLLGAAVGFALLSRVSPCNAGRPWWHKRGLLTDIGYWIVIPLFTRYARIGFTVLFTVYLLGIRSVDAIDRFYAHGHGVLAALPLWAQIAFYLVVSDFMLYWIHRAFHGAALWRFHAVHHSSEDLEWISAARFHPINIVFGTTLVDVLMLVAGLKPDVFLFLMPFTTITSVFVHANLDWTLGPFKYVLVSPVFHRWHHTLPDEGGNKNFATNFPVFDLLFGTFYLPEGRLPQIYGVAGNVVPDGLPMQMLYPLTR